jgi:protein phosphatase
MADKMEIKDITEQIEDKPLLLTSDGIHDHLSVDEMEQILAEDTSMRERLEKMIHHAIVNGSKDDISVVYVQKMRRK